MAGEARCELRRILLRIPRSPPANEGAEVSPRKERAGEQSAARGTAGAFGVGGGYPPWSRWEAALSQPSPPPKSCFSPEPIHPSLCRCRWMRMDVTTGRAARSDVPSPDSPDSVMSSRQCLQPHVPSQARLHAFPKEDGGTEGCTAKRCCSHLVSCCGKKGLPGLVRIQTSFG